MKAGLKARARAFFRRHFPERQIYLRSHGRVQFVVLTPPQQTIFAGMILVVLGWLAYASVSTVFHREIVASLEDRIADLKSGHEADVARARLDYEELNATLTLAEERFGRMTAALEGRQRDLESVYAQDAAADATMETVRARLARVALFDLGGRHDEPAHDALPEDAPAEDGAVPADGVDPAVDEGGDAAPAAIMNGTGGPESTPESTPKSTPESTPESTNDASATGIAPSTEPITPPTNSPDAGVAPRADNSDTARDRATVQLVATPAARQSVAFARAASKSYLGRRLAALDGRLMTLGDNQAELAFAIRTRVDGQIDKVLSSFETTEVNVSALVPPVDSAVGGPFIPADGIDPTDADSGALSADFELARLKTTMDRLERANEILLSVPLALPLWAPTSISSGFGGRSDPFSSGSAFHSGTDFRGRFGTPIHATAPGTVVTAERRSAYGLMVEIDHGNGIHTRFAHMQSLAVVDGQQIAYGQIVGTLGSTGRSTGPHLHYEVWYSGKARDPVSFFKAGQHVFER